jgi:hypothetical protein
MAKELKAANSAPESLSVKTARLEQGLISLAQGLKEGLAKLNKALDEVNAEVKALKSKVGE